MLSSACTVVCQHEVIKFMLHKPILSGRIGKWAYSIVEYDLSYEPLNAMKGQVVADFVVDHMIEIDSNACLVETIPWKLYFDGSECSKGQGIRC
jgi:membrane-bound ClpP family serine protease